LELGGANIASILAFDQGSMTSLLGENNKEYFNPHFPIIYKNKATKRDGVGNYFTNPMIQALKNNQTTSVKIMIQYIIKYQNNFISSYLFIKLLPKLIELKIEVGHLLESDIFNVKLDFDDWP
jgi:hypothetical protein